MCLQVKESVPFTHRVLIRAQFKQWALECDARARCMAEEGAGVPPTANSSDVQPSIRAKTPTDFLKSIKGKPVVVKLNSGVDYRGISPPPLPPHKPLTHPGIQKHTMLPPVIPRVLRSHWRGNLCLSELFPPHTDAQPYILIQLSGVLSPAHIDNVEERKRQRVTCPN